AGTTPFGALRIAGVHFHGDVEAGPAGANHERPDLDDFSDVNRSEEVQTTDVHRDTVAPGPSRCARVAGLIHPLHHRAAVHLAAEVDVAGLREEPECHTPLPLHQLLLVATIVTPAAAGCKRAQDLQAVGAALFLPLAKGFGGAARGEINPAIAGLAGDSVH